MSACRSCGAPIEWAWTAAGKHMPIDAEPTPDGNIVVIERRHDGSPSKIEVLTQEALNFGEERYTSHFATCPDAEQWRRSRGGA